MNQRQQRYTRNRAIRKTRLFLISTTLFLLTLIAITLLFLKKTIMQQSKQEPLPASQTTVVHEEPSDRNITTARITASGDMLYHDIVYGSAFDGEQYDFRNDYEQITPLISSADLALGDFEGTINPERPLAGYPIFNAPIEVVQSIKNAGFDAIDLAHNHILDTGIDGLRYTATAFRNAGIDIFGVKVEADEGILIKEVNGIKIAILGFCYGFNGLEETITQEEYEQHLYDLKMEKVKQQLETAEKIADCTIVMPQMGEEYRLTPTTDQIKTYHQMIEWGADIIFGGHPHVVEPTETIEKDGDKKFIIYSMGNLLSNQRLETLENSWTERGVIMDVTIQKQQQHTTITEVKAHPTWVSRTPIHRTFLGGPAYDYQVWLAENYLPGASQAATVDEETRQRIETAYHEVLDLLNIQF